jgi:methyl halide transferase
LGNKPLSYVFDIRDCCRHINEFCRGRVRGDLDADLLLRSAIERQIIIIGEALSAALKIAPELQQRISDPKKIIGMRNILVHNYSEVQLERLWEAATIYVPKLEREAEAVLTEYPPNRSTSAPVSSNFSGNYDQQNFAKSYASNQKPWDSGEVSAELKRVLDAGQLPGRTLLEIGCGTGTNAIELARRGYDVTAFDFVAQAVDAAREKAKAANVNVKFSVADALKDDLGGPYDVLFDRGVYHSLRKLDLKKFQQVLAQVTRKGSRWLTLAGNAKEQTQYGPPRVHEHEFRAELGGLFEFLDVREFRFGTDKEDFRPLGWAILMERK